LGGQVKFLVVKFNQWVFKKKNCIVGTKKEITKKYFFNEIKNFFLKLGNNTTWLMLRHNLGVTCHALGLGLGAMWINLSATWLSVHAM
jgi:hypothetical protein